MATKSIEMYDNRLLIQSVTPNYDYTDHSQRVMGSKSVAKNKREEKWWAVSAPDIRSWKLNT